MRALRINVYRDNMGDCTNGGISSKYDNLLLVCDEGYIEVDENNPPKNLVKIVTRHLFGEVVKHIEPYEAPTALGWMMGGNYAASSDYRFSELAGCYGALPIHDRQETQEQYDSFFN